MVKKKKKYKAKKSSSPTSFRQRGEDYSEKERSSSLSANSTSYKDHYDAA